MNFRLSCTWCSADSTAPGSRCAEHRHNQPQTAATKFVAPTGLWDQLLPSSWLLTPSAVWLKGLTGSSTQVVLTLVSVVPTPERLLCSLKCSFWREKLPVSLWCWNLAWARHRSRQGRMRVGASVRCWSLPVSCPSLPVDDAKARLFSAILRKWKILSGEIRGGKKASGAQCCRGTYCKHPENSADQFALVLFY